MSRAGGGGSRRGRGGSGRSKSSQRWLARQRKDPFAKQAQAQGRVSRAHFKLEELDTRCRLLRPGQRVLELGAAPGGWTRYIEERLEGGQLIAVDFRPITAGGDTTLIQGTCGDADTDNKINEIVGADGVDLVLSDMAPNISGIRVADQAASMALAELAEGAADAWLKPGGRLVVKLFQGEGVDAWLKRLRGKYRKVRLLKPKASRPDSREVYAVAEQFRAAGTPDAAG